MSFRDRLSFASFSMFCFPNLFCCFIFSEAERVLGAMAQDVCPRTARLMAQRANFDQQKSELAEVQAKAVQLKASIVYYEGMLALVAPEEVASTPTEMLSETEALILNGGQVASTSSLGADEHLKGVPRKQD
jgi:uncharacterized protein YlxW (UPF0749 family)